MELTNNELACDVNIITEYIIYLGGSITIEHFGHIVTDKKLMLNGELHKLNYPYMTLKGRLDTKRLILDESGRQLVLS